MVQLLFHMLPIWRTESCETLVQLSSLMSSCVAQYKHRSGNLQNAKIEVAKGLNA